MHEDTPNPKAERFLVVSNGRCGSTWLLTSLAQIPGVYADWEFKWRPDYPLAAVHRAFTGADNTCHDVIKRLGGDGRSIGAKITMDPWLSGRIPCAPDQIKGFLVHDIQDFTAAIENDVIIVHIVRNYWDILKSGFGRGYVHKVSPSAESAGSAQALGSSILSASSNSPAGSIEPIDATKAKRVLASLMINDLYLLSLDNGVRPYQKIWYEDIGAQFIRLSRSVAPWLPEHEIKDYSQASFTEKLPAIDDEAISCRESVKDLFMNASRMITGPAGIEEKKSAYFSVWLPILTGSVN